MPHFFTFLQSAIFMSVSSPIYCQRSEVRVCFLFSRCLQLFQHIFSSCLTCSCISCDQLQIKSWVWPLCVWSPFKYACLPWQHIQSPLLVGIGGAKENPIAAHDLNFFKWACWQGVTCKMTVPYSCREPCTQHRCTCTRRKPTRGKQSGKLAWNTSTCRHP